MTKADKFEGCILGGAIGDAWGSGYENQRDYEKDVFFFAGIPEAVTPLWQITDDTQLTLATIEALQIDKTANPETVARQFLKYHKQRKLRGIGASTLKALEELKHGGQWSQVGRRGEYAAGNGVAMRIAPLAFIEDITFDRLRDISIITHHNDEAYIGAKSVFIALREILNGNWKGDSNLIELIIEQLPDTRVRDRFIAIKDLSNIKEVGLLGNNGYVVNSVPLAIAAANKVLDIGIEGMYSQLLEVGGDTDTNCSIAGQIAGALIGREGIPDTLLNKLKKLKDFEWIDTTIRSFIESQNWV